MKGICDSGAFGHIPCKSDAAPEAVTDPEALAIFKEACPTLAAKDTLCCDKDQILDMKNTFDLYGLFLKPCPSCFANYMNIFCNMVCSPDQKKFMKVIATEKSDDGQEGVSLVDVFIKDGYGKEIYESCQNVTRFGMKTIDTFCKPWSADKCNYQRMLHYITSDLNHFGHHPYQVDLMFTETDNYNFENEDYAPLTDKVYKCSEGALGKDKCPCDHCPGSC